MSNFVGLKESESAEICCHGTVMDLRGLNTVSLSLLSFMHIGHEVLVLKWKVPSEIYTVVFWLLEMLRLVKKLVKILVQPNRCLEENHAQCSSLIWCSQGGAVQTPHLIASLAFGVEGHLKMTIKYSFLIVGVRK